MTSPTAAYVDATGIHTPSSAAVLAYLQASYRNIYGQDIPFDSSDQDTEWVTIIMAAINDANAMAVQVYNSFSPLTAVGTGLSSVVKVNGITRDLASYSTVDVICIGQAGRAITGPKIVDPAGYYWALPNFVFPLSGAITVTATCATLGAIAAPAGTLWGISTPQLGWQSVSNASDGSPGAGVETDPQLKVRQFASTGLPSQNVLDGILAAILALPNVTRLRAYENDTSVVDANGIPGHTISLVVDGGDTTAIATAIALKKTPGAGTYGTAVATITSAQGVARDIRFFRPIEPAITYLITVRPFAGYTTDTEAAIQQSLSDWTNALGIGTSVLLTRAYGPALLAGAALMPANANAASLYEIVSIAIARDGAVPQIADIVVAFNEAPFCLPSYVNIGYVTP